MPTRQWVENVFREEEHLRNSLKTEGEFIRHTTGKAFSKENMYKKQFFSSLSDVTLYQCTIRGRRMSIKTLLIKYILER